MRLLLALAVVTLAAQPTPPTLERRTFKMPDGTMARYGLAVPGDYTASSPRPLVVALHPGGSSGMVFYGDRYMRSVFLPGLQGLDPIMIAPDAPAGAWTEPKAEQVVLSLVTAVAGEFAVDKSRMLLAGFSMGGGGAWYLSARHPTLFTAAIVMAGRTAEPIEALARIPTYVIHSRADEVVPFEQAEVRAAALEKLGRPIHFEALNGVGHFNMGGYMGALQRGGQWVREQWGRVR